MDDVQHSSPGQDPFWQVCRLSFWLLHMHLYAFRKALDELSCGLQTCGQPLNPPQANHLSALQVILSRLDKTCIVLITLASITGLHLGETLRMTCSSLFLSTYGTSFCRLSPSSCPRTNDVFVFKNTSCVGGKNRRITAADKPKGP